MFVSNLSPICSRSTFLTNLGSIARWISPLRSISDTFRSPGTSAAHIHAKRVPPFWLQPWVSPLFGTPYAPVFLQQQLLLVVDRSRFFAAQNRCKLTQIHSNELHIFARVLFVLILHRRNVRSDQQRTHHVQERVFSAPFQIQWSVARHPMNARQRFRNFGQLLQNLLKMICVVVNSINSMKVYTSKPSSTFSMQVLSLRHNHFRDSRMFTNELIWF